MFRRITKLCQIFRIFFQTFQIPNLINNDTLNSNINSDPVSIATKILDQYPNIIDKRRENSIQYSIKKTARLKKKK